MIAPKVTSPHSPISYSPLMRVLCRRLDTSMACRDIRYAMSSEQSILLKSPATPLADAVTSRARCAYVISMEDEPAGHAAT